MPSGKRSRQRRAAPAPPPVRSKGSPARARSASPRVIVAVVAVAVAVAIAIILAVALGGGGKSSSIPKNLPAVGSVATGLPGAAAVQREFAGIPQHGTTLGKPSAPVTLTEYVDMQCPYCQQFETQVMPGLVSDYVRSGKVKVVLEPWAFIGPDSSRGQAAVLAAGQQNLAFNYATVLYDNQGTENTGWLSDAMVAQAAASIPGLHVQQLLNERNSSTVAGQAKKVDSDATAAGVNSTPTLFVGKSGTAGRMVSLSSPTDRAAVDRAIASALKS